MDIVNSKDYSSELLTTALAVSNLGVWEWKIAEDSLYWSDELRRIYGITDSQTVTLENYKKMLHPEDASAMSDLIVKALKNGNEYNVEHRIIWQDGSVHWVQACGKAFLKNNKAYRMVGTAQNIDNVKTIAKKRDELIGRNTLLEYEHDELLALNQSKDEFISLASHQLRTPATGVKQYISMLLEGYAGNVTPEQHSMLQTAYTSNERQLSIIDDLLRVAHIDSGKVVLKKTKNDLVELVCDIINEQKSKFKVREQKVSLTSSSPKIVACADKDRLRMAIENIIDNASKYSPQGMPVTVAITQTAHKATIAVQDKGVGIAKKDLAKLFHKFSRISNALTMKVSGTGLGLYWANQIIKLHGGTITVTSRPQKGTTFTIQIPKK